MRENYHPPSTNKNVKGDAWIAGGVAGEHTIGNGDGDQGRPGLLLSGSMAQPPFLLKINNVRPRPLKGITWLPRWQKDVR